MRQTRSPGTTGTRAGRWTGFAALILLAFAASAADPAKIGYVDMKRLLDNAPQVIEARARLEKEFATRDTQLKADEASLADKEKRYARDAAIMAKADADKLAAEIDALKRGTKRARDQLREELSTRTQDELSKRWPEIYDGVVEYAREQGYDLVVQAPVLYASPSIDITDAVLERLKRQAASKTSPK
jgi:outer membrane protein